MTTEDPAAFSRRLAATSLSGNDPTGWFDQLYASADAGETSVPWDRGAPHPLLVEWVETDAVAGPGSALVVGCGFGFDSEYVAGLGFDTTAFDVSPTAIETTKRRYPGSGVRYEVADLLDLPRRWTAAFDLVVEILTVQSLPVDVRSAAIGMVAEAVAPGGTLLVIAAARNDDEPIAGPPWPLAPTDVGRFSSSGLRRVRVERIESVDNPGMTRWRAEFRAD